MINLFCISSHLFICKFWDIEKKKRNWWKCQNIIMCVLYLHIITLKWFSLKMLVWSYIFISYFVLLSIQFFNGQPYCLATILNIIFTFNHIIDAFIWSETHKHFLLASKLKMLVLSNIFVYIFFSGFVLIPIKRLLKPMIYFFLMHLHFLFDLLYCKVCILGLQFILYMYSYIGNNIVVPHGGGGVFILIIQK